MKIIYTIFSIFFLLEIASLVLCIPTQGVKISMDVNNSVEVENKVINGDFENSNKFDAWEQVSWPSPGLANIVTVYEGKRHACLQAASSEQRIGYRQRITNLEKGDWNLNFAIKHDGGTHYQAGFTIYFYNTNQIYLGRTYWIVSNQAGGVNDSENLYFDIRKKSEFNWYVVNVNLSDSMFRPDTAKNLTIIDSLEVFLHVYGVSGSGTGISLSYDALLLLINGENRIINGGFENSDKFETWEQVSWPSPGLANIVTVYEGKRHACLQAASSEQRIGYRQRITNLEKGDWNLNFAIKHDGGTHYQAGFTIYFYNTNQIYLGRTYWIVSNQAGGVNDSENLYFDIRKKSEFNWYVVNVNLSDSMFRPDTAKNLTIIDSLEVFLHVYGVSGSGAGVKVSYDEISFAIDTSPNKTSEGSQTSGIPVLSPSLEIEITLFSMIVSTILLLRVRRKK